MAAPGSLRATVVVTTYNSPRSLTVVLDAISRQTVHDFEILVADDGSGAETRAVIDRFRAGERRPLQHVWHPDEGVRRCTIANKAILAATGDYLVFLDGDCVPPAHWLEAHLAAAEPGWFVAGGKVLMNERLTEAIHAGQLDPRRLEHFTLRWREIQKSRRLLVSRVPLLRLLLNRNLQRRCGWVGEDSSTYKEHLHRVGGFDERFTILWEDADISERLKAAGIRGRSIRYLAPVLHLEHARSYRSREMEDRNYRLFRQNQAEGVIATPHGLGLHR